MIFACLTFLAQQFTEVRASFEQQVSTLKEGQNIICERLGVIDQRITTNQLKN